jgi:hypothetical protein
MITVKTILLACALTLGMYTQVNAATPAPPPTCIPATQYHLDLATGAWQDWKVYLADNKHGYPDASDEPSANADRKNMEHELDWVRVNGGNLGLCPKQAIIFYNLDVFDNKISNQVVLSMVSTPILHLTLAKLAIGSQKRIDSLAADARALQAAHYDTTALRAYILDMAQQLGVARPDF